jgi:hypothetical protein
VYLPVPGIQTLTSAAHGLVASWPDRGPLNQYARFGCQRRRPFEHSSASSVDLELCRLYREWEAGDRLATTLRYREGRALTDLHTLTTGLVIGESARWHDGRLWFAHWGTQEIAAIGLDGTREVLGNGRPGLGWSIDWLPDGRLLMTGAELTRQEPDGALVRHADLSALTDHWNEIVVDDRGNIYINRGTNFHPEEGVDSGVIALVTADGAVRKVAEDIAFPNGMIVTPTIRRWSSPSRSAANSPRSTSPPTVACPTEECGPITPAMASAWTPKAPYGARP